MPILSGPVALKNHSGRCGYHQPRWVQQASNGPLHQTWSLRAKRRAADFDSFLDSSEATGRPWIHLIDGGVSDNLGLRGPLESSIARGGFRDHALAEEWTTDVAPTEFIQGLLEKFLRQHLKVTAPVTHRWAASVGYTPDGLPVLEEVRPKTWAVGGYNGTGNIAGALSARAAARLACGKDSAWAEAIAAARAHADKTLA